jgi:hypothetical protein
LGGKIVSRLTRKNLFCLVWKRIKKIGCAPDSVWRDRVAVPKQGRDVIGQKIAKVHSFRKRGTRAAFNGDSPRGKASPVYDPTQKKAATRDCSHVAAVNWLSRDRDRRKLFQLVGCDCVECNESLRHRLQLLDRFAVIDRDCYRLN